MARQDVIIKMRLAGEEFDREFKLKFQELEAAAERQSLAAGARSGSGFVKGFLGAAGIAGLGTAIGSAISSAADLGQEIASTSRQFNIGAEQLQIWRQAAASAGVSSNDLSQGLAELTKTIGEAAAGNRAAQQAFVDLGIGFETTAGAARATDAVLLDLAKRISEIEDPSERVRLGTDLLGSQFKDLHPLLLQGADGFNSAAAELDRFGGALSAEEIRNLEETNRKIEELKNQLSRSIAKVVADNADAITGLADSLFTLAGAAVKATGDFLTFLNTQSRYNQAVAALPRDLTGDQRKAAIADLDRRFGRRETVTGSYLGGLIKFKDVRFQPDTYSDWAGPGGFLARYPGTGDQAAPPRVTGGGGAARRSASGGRARSATASAAEREAERAAKEALRNEEQLRDAIARTLKAQQDSAEVARIRAEQGEEAAARAEAELAFLRQHPLAVHDTVEALAKALGITKALTEADRARLQLLIDQGNAAQAALGDAAAQKVREAQARAAAQQAEEAERIAAQQAEDFRRLHEQAILDLADLYETAFRGGTRDLWRSFRDEGLRIIAEIAAQWTLAMLAGKPFSFNAALDGALGRSPLARLFGFGGIAPGALVPGAANDNGLASVLQKRGSLAKQGALGAPVDASRIAGEVEAALRNKGAAAAAAPRADFLASPGFSLALGSLAGSLVGGKGTASQLGGLAGAIGGQSLGSGIKALGKFGGPIGAVVGAVLGSVLPGLLSGTKRGSATVGAVGGTLGITGTRGNSASRKQTASQSASSLIDAIFQIADQLGGTIDPTRGAVSIGVRKNNFRVDTSGRGITKTRNGAVDFGGDQEAAIRFAIADLIKDGVITGISQASQNLITKGGDLEKQIEKALLIEQIPKLLKQRTDPLGAALDELYEKFRKVNDALVEGSASAEQFAQARQLWELEKADAIASIGAASQTLKDFLASLAAGPDSPLSLREQRAEAERQLAPYLAQISAAEAARAEVERLRASGASAEQIAAAETAARSAATAIDQRGFAEASQLLLSISRQANASSLAYFSDFDRIRALAGQAAGFIDQASAREADNRDPFASAIAQNTSDTAQILAEHTRILTAMNDNIAVLAARGGSASDFIYQPRAYAR